MAITRRSQSWRVPTLTWPGRRTERFPGRFAATPRKPTPPSSKQLHEQLLAHVTANPGQRGDQIAQAVGSDVGTIRPVMRKLIEAKSVRTEVQRRGMTYHAGGGGRSAKKKSTPARGRRKGARKAKQAPKVEAPAAE